MTAKSKLKKTNVKISSKYQFPLRQRNHYELLIDGENYFPAILNDINQAHKFIYIEMYLVSSGKICSQFIDALSKAVARGVKVFTLFDHHGSKDFSQQDVRRLDSANINFAWYNPVKVMQLRASLHRNHRKIIVIDGAIAWTGGTGITDSFAYNKDPSQYWHESMIRIQGKCVQDWQKLFEQVWSRWSTCILPSIDVENSQLLDQSSESYSQQGRVVSSSAIYSSEVRRSLLTKIRGANKRIWLATAYFVPSRKLRKSLMKAAKRGVDVRIMLPGPITDLSSVRYMARRYYAKLLKHGIRIYEYQKRFIHAKYSIVDHWVSNGSSNLDVWNLVWNLDANQEMFDTNIAAMHEKMFLHDMESSHCFTLIEWKKRSWWSRVWEYFWGRVRGGLAWFSRREALRHHH
ncbi:Cardiolipin synthetase [hydrothermal vent metagenome]|uniref:Cardiolipin synthetase n=1 Tax=hydrothermal vent metagenome TaxID=652676 RepID=A0A3B0Z309_9ZZZZ